ncbi:hypothetical protein EJB05_00764, partial [Eragrostis curvula]
MKNSKGFARTSISDLDDDVVGLVLERIGSHVCLIRAASTCKRWRRVIADAAFLRRFRSLHAPTVAGTYHNDTPTFVAPAARETRGPVFVPSPSSSSIEYGRRHSLDFLPHGGGGKAWAVIDSRGGLLLLMTRRRRVDPNKEDVTVVVCEPLTRRYIEIPPPPVIANGSDHYVKGSYLVDGDAADEAGGRIGMSNFRVFFDVCRAWPWGDGVPHAAAVFTAAGDGSSWSEKAMDQIMAPRHDRPEKMDYVSPHYCRARVFGNIAGSRYTYLEGGTLVALDCSTGEFSSSQLPASKYSWDLTSWPFSFHAVEGHDGKPRLFTLFFDEMRVFARTGGSGGNWRLEKSILLTEATCGLPGYDQSLFKEDSRRTFKLLTRGPGFVILNTPFNPAGLSAFSLNLETMEVAPAADDMGQIFEI